MRFAVESVAPVQKNTCIHEHVRDSMMWVEKSVLNIHIKQKSWNHNAVLVHKPFT